MKLFIGMELEGKHQGRKTLFIEGHVPADLILRNISPEYEQLYFGARYQGNTNSVVGIDIVEAVARSLNGSPQPLIITADVSGESLHHWIPLMRECKRLELMITVPHSLKKCLADGLEELRSAGLSDRVQVKFRGGKHLIVLPLSGSVSNTWKGYKEDRLIWKQ